jgi:predicted alpha/beta hydrolase
LAVRLRAPDGYELGGTLYTTAGGPPPARVVLLHCGAGIPAVSYGRFALFLAGHGMPTLTYDYRGIGQSRPATLRGFDASLEDWAEYDCAAAVSWLRGRFPDAEMVGIAHSVGAFLLGGAGNAGEQARLVLIGGHTGYYGDYGERYRLPMAVVWHGIMPAMTRLFGYFPARRLGLGEDIPQKIALYWAARRSAELRPSGTDPGSARVQMLLDRCAALQRPTLLVSISDDAFATPAGMRRLMAYYPRLSPLRHLQFTPADAGLRRIGHFGFFRRRAGCVLWPRLLAQLDAEPA